MQRSADRTLGFASQRGRKESETADKRMRHWSASCERESQRVDATWTGLALHVPFTALLCKGDQVKAEFDEVGMKSTYKDLLFHIGLPGADFEVGGLCDAIVVDMLALTAMREHNH